MFTKEQREELIERIVLDCRGDSYTYRNFVSDCVAGVVANWPDEGLARWTHGDDTPLACIFCEQADECITDTKDCSIIKDRKVLQ